MTTALGIVPAKVCVSENLVITDTGVLRMAPWSVPRLVIDVRADSAGDGQLLPAPNLPGKLCVEAIARWKNPTPVDHMMRITVIRRWRSWIVSNPNSVQFRDRWTWGIDEAVDVPIPSTIFNGQCGSAVDIGTNTIAEPNPGLYHFWWGTTSADEWVGPIKPGQTLRLWYRLYVWTPPPFSDNANKNNPLSGAEAGWSRISGVAYPLPGKHVTT